ncbi:MAG TPA: NUDIX hydrolase [Jatrophihabitantaceae bacterium]|nr:NUDIX hydrolase [Jatrophihabitantaceae bacterium]
MAAQRSVASGGVVWRGTHARVEVALVHRPRYDDWSLPKGKVHDGELAIAAAVREVGEELGAATMPSRRLGSVRYTVDGMRKDVTFWAMRYRGGSFTPSAEVDEVRWLRVADARELARYDTDRVVLDEFAEMPPPDAVVMLLRHAKAGKRADWDGPDLQRPLDDTGRAQALALVPFLSCFGIDRVISATPARCVQTVEPFAKGAGVAVEVDATFDDEVFVEAPSAALTGLLSLAKPGHVALVCSQGITIPALIDRIAGGIVDSDTRKGAAWVLSLVDGDIVDVDYYDDPAERRSVES